MLVLEFRAPGSLERLLLSDFANVTGLQMSTCWGWGMHPLSAWRLLLCISFSSCKGKCVFGLRKAEALPELTDLADKDSFPFPQAPQALPHGPLHKDFYSGLWVVSKCSWDLVWSPTSQCSCTLSQCSVFSLMHLHLRELARRSFPNQRQWWVSQSFSSSPRLSMRLWSQWMTGTVDSPEP